MVIAVLVDPNYIHLAEEKKYDLVAYVIENYCAMRKEIDSDIVVNVYPKHPEWNPTERTELYKSLGETTDYVLTLMDHCMYFFEISPQYDHYYISKNWKQIPKHYNDPKNYEFEPA